MRTVVIKNCEYEVFEEHRDMVLDNAPYSLISATYSKKLRLAVFQFWDSDYIPENLQKFIVRPKKMVKG